MPAFRSLLSTFSSGPAPNRFAATVPTSWMQGRTTYGGCSAALCLEAARRAVDDDGDGGAAPPPRLRSAQVTFVGAAGGDVDIETDVLRKGKAMQFVRADLSSGGGLATTGLFAFGAARPSVHDLTVHEELSRVRPGDLPGPDDSVDLLATEGVPKFMQHFEARVAQGGLPVSASSHTDQMLWVRHRGAGPRGEMEGVAPDVLLLALADMPPPAIIPMFREWRPISSVTWQVNVLSDAPRAAHDGGWWLVRTAVEAAKDGYSSQNMAVFGSAAGTGDGGAPVVFEPVLVGRQAVAIFE